MHGLFGESSHAVQTQTGLRNSFAKLKNQLALTCGTVGSHAQASTHEPNGTVTRQLVDYVGGARLGCSSVSHSRLGNDCGATGP